ncbi:MAG: glutamine--tRNA ligase/YqeY domain fusion protein, partial [Alloprevotella sp.]
MSTTPELSNEQELVNEKKESLNFIEQIVKDDLAAGKNGGRLQTRFPPEPNGYLHIGHAKAIALDFGIAERFGGVCNLRMDDTNPQKEDHEYVEAIKHDIEWLGYKWDNIYYASDYFQDLWDFAVALIKQGRAYVDEQSSEQIAAQKGTPTRPGTESPYRDRPVEESLRLFEEMNSGNVEPGKMVLRAKIDMASDNMHFRDPIMYRVLNMPHIRTGNHWNAYPMYDFTHGQSDFLEGVTHSICTLEFVPHRPLYDLFVDWYKEVRGEDLADNRPRQFEFNKLNLNYTLMSKRNLLLLTKEGVVNGWDDPRMPTLCGIRRRGYSPESIRMFIDKIGYTTFDALNDIKLLESAARTDLNERATRVSAVLDPVKLIITNYPEGQSELLEVQNNPERPEEGTHTIEFSRELWIERADFKEVADKKFFRMAVGKETRLKSAYIVDCTGCKKNEETGEIEEIYCTYDPTSKAGTEGANRKVKGTIHWLSCDHCLPAEVRNYACLWTCENPRDAIKQYEDEHGVRGIEAMRPFLNPDSIRVNKQAFIEKFAQTLPALSYLQFTRTGYYNIDPDS